MGSVRDVLDYLDALKAKNTALMSGATTAPMPGMFRQPGADPALGVGGAPATAGILPRPALPALDPNKDADNLAANAALAGTAGNMGISAAQGLLAGPSLYEDASEGRLDYSKPETLVRAMGVTAGMGGPGMIAGAAEKEAGRLGTFGGRGAAEADIPGLKTAQIGEKLGADPSTILKSTGWFRGADGGMRFEIPDQGASLSDIWHLPNVNGQPLGNVLDHPELFRQYPELANTEFRNQPQNDIQRSSFGTYNPGGGSAGQGSLFLNKEVLDKHGESPLGTVLHELQHGIQEREGFEPGSNEVAAEKSMPISFGAAQDLKKLNEYRDLDAQKGTSHGVDKWFRSNQGRDPDPTARALFDRLSPEDIKKIPTDAYEAYNRNAGEVEARNVSRRAGFSQNMLGEYPPWQTQDVANDRQLFNASSSPDTSASAPASNNWQDVLDYAKKNNILTPYEQTNAQHRVDLWNRVPDNVAAHKQAIDTKNWPNIYRGEKEFAKASDAYDSANGDPEKVAQSNAAQEFWKNTENNIHQKLIDDTSFSSGDIADRLKGINPNGLPMNPKAVRDRAKSMGFDTGTTYYHGTDAKEFNEFKVGTPSVPATDTTPFVPPSDAGVFLSKSPNVAEYYAKETGQIMPLRAKMDNPRVIDMRDPTDPIHGDYPADGSHPGFEKMQDYIQQAKDAGHDSMVLKGINDVSGSFESNLYSGQARKQNHYVVFDPNQVRSKYAVFDPLRRNEGDILAAGGLGVPGMANKNSYDDPKYSSAPTPPADNNSRNSYDDPTMSVPPPDTGSSRPDGALGYVNAAARSAANAATFGGADKVANLIHRITGTPGDEEQNTAGARKDYPYTSLAGEVAGGAAPAIAGGLGVARAIPALGRATIRSMAGNAAVTGAGMSAARDAVRGETDPTKYAKDAVTQGIEGGLLGGAVGGVTRALPMGKFRAVGANIPTNAIDDAANFAQRSGAAGVPVTAPEAMRATHPEHAGELEGLYNSAVRSPEGSQRAASFEATRSPLIDVAARRAANAMGPEIRPVDASNSASAAINAARDIINRSAEPYYTASANTMMPPAVTNPPQVAHAGADALLRRPIEMGDLSQTTGRPIIGQGPGTPQPGGANIPPDSVTRDVRSILPRPPQPAGGAANGNVPDPPATIPLAVNDKVRHQLGSLFTRAQEHEPRTAALIARGRDDVTNQMAAADPNFARGLDIERQGRSMMLDHVQAGPLGKIAATDNPAAQSSQLFGVKTPEEGEAASRAARAMDSASAVQGLPHPQPSLGLLAGHLQRAAADGPSGFARALPSDASMRVAGEAAGPRMASLAPTIDALRALRPTSLPATDEIHGYGLGGMMWRAARDLGKGQQTRIMQDPSNIPLLGTVGRGSRNIMAALLSAMQDANR